MLDNIIIGIFVGCTALIIYNLIKLVVVVVKHFLGK
jgi:hypothetical protein